MPLTDTALRNAKPRDLAYKLSDRDGLYLLVSNSGSKLWRFDYRFLSKRKTLALANTQSRGSPMRAELAMKHEHF